MMRKRLWFPGVILLVMAFLVGACGSDDAADTAAGDSCDTSAEVEVTEGLTYQEIECGEGDEAAAGDLVSVHYTGTLEDGTEFDSSVGGDPFEFTIGAAQVIEGWEQGIPGMRVGGKRELTIGPDLAYGDAGAGGVIPPNATLIFEVELVEILPEPTSAP
jgi:FKBP-type peptidyl-prolyl cis-trans isomerase